MVDLSKTKQRLTDWGFETVVVCKDKGQDNQLLAYLNKSNSDRYCDEPNTSKGVWKRQTYKGMTLYGLRSHWRLSIKEALSAMHGGNEVSMIRGNYWHGPNWVNDTPGLYLIFEPDDQRLQMGKAKPVYHRVDEVRTWVSEREGDFHWFEYPGERLQKPSYAIFCVGEATKFEFKMRWSVSPREAA